MKDFPPDVPRLDPVPFVVADVVLVGFAIFLYSQAEAPLTGGPLAAIAACVGLGAVIGLYPFVVNHARRQEEALQERANQIEALARTVAASAEQISIAAANLPAIAENAARQLRVAEQLPATLHGQLQALQLQVSATASEENAALRRELETLRAAETSKLVAALQSLDRATQDAARQLQVAEQLPATLQGQLQALQLQVSTTASAENAALRHEIETLRAAETDKLVAALQSLDRATQDAARLESLAAKHTTTLDATLAQLPRLAESLAEQATHTLRRETANAVSAIEAAADSARIKIDASAHTTQSAVAAAAEQARATLEHAVREGAATLAAAVPVAAAPVSEVIPPPNPPVAEQQATPAPLAPVSPALMIDDTGLDEPVAPPELIPTTDTGTERPEPPQPLPEPETIAVAAPAPELTPETATFPASETASEPAAEPTPEPAPKLEPEPASEAVSVSPPEPEPDAAPEPVSEPEPEPETIPEPAAEPEPAPGHSEPALSNDGFTRLIVTAYIGIGNKLFIRGDGPGLRRDKGVALQFVSIGKWRWESAELLFPAKVRLYKNDQTECSALGEFALEPGHHHEVNATF